MADGWTPLYKLFPPVCKNS